MAMSAGPAAVVLRPLGLGDLLTGVPAIRAVRAAVPGHRLVLATTAALAPIADLIDAVDEVLPARELEPLDWTGPPPDLAVDLHGKGPASHVVVAALDPARLLTFDSPGYPGPRWCPDEHEVRRWCRLLDECGIDADPDDLDLAAPADAPVVSGATVVHPGAASPSRRWPAERFACVARELERSGHQVLVTGVDAERDLAAAVVREAGLPEERNGAGQLGLGTLAATVAAARLVICGDTGVAHLATAYRTPSVVLFGPMSPELWGPPPDRPAHRVLWPGPTTGAADRGPHPSLLEISVDAVLVAARDLTGATPARREAGRAARR
jgi:ADP-heptose:LPS heptosyltransferase